jgi:plastocyanin
VDEAGLVTALAEGTTLIRASLTADGTTRTDSASVTVTSGVIGMLIVTTPGTSFDPSSAAIAVGDTVRWQFSGAVHNVTFNSVAPPGGNIPDQNTGSNVERVFPAAGTYGYECTRHNGMTGKIIVQAMDGTPTYSSLAVTPAFWAMRIGADKTLVATPLDQNGLAMTGLPAPTFSSSDPTIASVDAVGTLAAATEGSVTVSASLAHDGATHTATSSVDVVPASAITVTVGGGAFSPDRVDIAPGGTVIFEVVDGLHNVTFQTPPPDGNIPDLSAGNAVARTFPSAGDYDYECTLHGENGRVRVR